jgi:hypothetical protein
MTISRSCRFALSSCVAAAMLAGCGGAHLPAGAPGSAPQTSAILTHADRGKSWMSPDTKEIKKLLYVSDAATDDVFVYDYVSGKEVGKLTGFDDPGPQCVDELGNVYIASASGLSIYSHAGVA